MILEATTSAYDANWQWYFQTMWTTFERLRQLVSVV